MRVEADPAGVTARLDDEARDAVLGVAEGQDGGSLEGALPPGLLDVVRDALVTCSLVVAGRASRLEHRVWVDATAATLLLGVRPGEHQLMAAEPAFLAAALVRLTRLRPHRTRAGAPVASPVGRLDDVVSADPDRRALALAGLGGLGATHGWRLDVGWPGGRRRVTAVDGDAGVHLVEHPADGTGAPGDALVPVSNTTVYRIFATALPAEALAG